MKPDPTSGTSVPITIESHLGSGTERRLADDVLDGLTHPFKELQPKHFYDARGSELFERICKLPEYYPTRTELAILEANAAEIARTTGAEELVELGSGAATKARLLLGAMRDAGNLRRYVPVDVSESALVGAAEELFGEFGGLEVHGVVADFERHLGEIPAAAGGRLVAFLGGTIGNFQPGSRRRLLRDISGLLGPGDHLLLGTDLVKDPEVIEAAYDDGAGVTAQFNLNVLHVINRELHADFDPGDFDHVAFFDREREWIEMRLRARRDCRVSIADLDVVIDFDAGEEVRTEISCKFTHARLASDLASAGLELRGWFEDPDGLFAVTLAGPIGAEPRT
jgi:L-histidine N-alpha-methyltransferase